MYPKSAIRHVPFNAPAYIRFELFSLMRAARRYGYHPFWGWRASHMRWYRQAVKRVAKWCKAEGLTRLDLWALSHICWRWAWKYNVVMPDATYDVIVALDSLYIRAGAEA